MVFAEELLGSEFQGKQAAAGSYGQNTYHLVYLTDLCNLETWDLKVLGTSGLADILGLVGIEDQGRLGIWDQGLTGIEGPGELGDAGLVGPDSQVVFEGPVQRCQCWTGGLGSSGRLVEAQQLQPHYHPHWAMQCSSQGRLDELHLGPASRDLFVL